MITVADHVFRLLTYHFNSYGSFASTKYHDKGLLGEEFNSLEYVHNNIHVSPLTRLSPEMTTD
jgi:hypothetical protein